MTEAMDTLTAQVEATDAKLDAIGPIFSEQKATIAALQAQLTASGNQDSALQALADKLKSHTDGIDAVLNPPAPAADPTPPVTP